MKALILDDNPFMIEILADKLKSEGFEVLKALNSKDGIAQAEKESPDVIAMDLPLPDDSGGLNTLKQLKEGAKTKDTPIIVLSNDDTDQYKEKVVGMGVNGYLIKPYTNAEEIVATILQFSKNKDAAPVIKDAEKKDGDSAMKYDSPFTKSTVNIGVPPKIKARVEKALVSPREELSIINLVGDLVEYAFHARASDIHLEPYSDRMLVRMRIDGILYDVFTLPKNTHSEVIARIKVLAGMRTDEHQTAQDGRFKTAIKDPPRQFDIRVSMVPTYYGENSVLRLLAEQSTVKKVDDLAFTKEDKEKIHRAIKKPYGMILATGPTGSGKSTTLYTIIRELNSRDVSIITIEDPVEYSIEGIDQIQVNTRTGLTFANGLRSILRQDPNVIMVGEIRDKETASIAVNAALTGHKLLSTLHTNDAATTLPRLLDMDVEPFLIASTVNIVIGQRLVRMLCQHCKQKRKFSKEEVGVLSKSIPATLLKDNIEFYEPKGCSTCGDMGYFDRMGIYEILEMSDDLRPAILRRADASEIRDIAVKNGMTTLMEDGFRKAVAGLTSIEEILRAVKE
ncbi:MAG: ATPase, T2SS/T4P/T4SS family [bacterium]|nr:ATPase, T2SS/T4P/T4SS family [bacterium]